MRRLVGSLSPDKGTAGTADRYCARRGSLPNYVVRTLEDTSDLNQIQNEKGRYCVAMDFGPGDSIISKRAIGWRRIGKSVISSFRPTGQTEWELPLDRRGLQADVEDAAGRRYDRDINYRLVRALPDSGPILGGNGSQKRGGGQYRR
jgi:hypothetical protein